MGCHTAERREKVEEAVRILQVGDRIRLERVYHVRELDEVADEEYWEIVAN